jgi:hypothetical protein
MVTGSCLHLRATNFIYSVILFTGRRREHFKFRENNAFFFIYFFYLHFSSGNVFSRVGSTYYNNTLRTHNTRQEMFNTHTPR